MKTRTLVSLALGSALLAFGSSAAAGGDSRSGVFIGFYSASPPPPVVYVSPGRHDHGHHRERRHGGYRHGYREGYRDGYRDGRHGNHHSGYGHHGGHYSTYGGHDRPLPPSAYYRGNKVFIVR